jgi:hypothetical protein
MIEMVSETEMVRVGGDGEGEGDEGRRRYLKKDEDIEISNALCVIWLHRPNSVHL